MTIGESFRQAKIRKQNNVAFCLSREGQEQFYDVLYKYSGAFSLKDERYIS